MPNKNIPKTAKAIKYSDSDFHFTEKHSKQFYNNGFIVIDNVFNIDEIATLKDVVDTELEKNAPINKLSWPLHKLEAAKNDSIKKLACDPRLVNITKSLIGDNIQLQHSKFAIKPPGQNKGTVNWHQDFAFFPHTNDSLIAVTVALTEATIENGAMIMIQGSHRQGLLNHQHSDGKFAEECLNEPILNEENLYNLIKLAPGSIAIHHCLTVHCSHDNYTNLPRYMLVFEYRAGDAYQLADGIWEDTGIQISGEKSEKIRLGGRFLKKDKNNNMLIKLPRSERYGEDYPFGHAYNQLGKLAK